MLLSPGNRAGRSRKVSSVALTSLGIAGNVGLAATAGTSALTITLTDAAGDTPTAGSPVKYSTQNTTEITGTPVEVEVTSATTLVVPSGATLGVPAAEGFRLWILGTSDGTLAVTFRAPDAFTIYGLSEFGLIPTDALAISGTADSAKIIYATADPSALAYRILGMLEWDESGIVTPGTWADTGGIPDNLLRITLFSPGMPTPGAEMQTEGSAVVAYITAAGTIPFDDTKPTDSEGIAITTQTITPTSAANILEIEAHVSASCTLAAFSTLSIFEAATSTSLSSSWGVVPTADLNTDQDARHRMRAPGSSQITFESRVGCNSGTTHINGDSSGAARVYGGACTGWLQAKELMT